MVLFFIVLQLILLGFMLFHDWIPLPPFNDVNALKKSESGVSRLLGSLINGTFVFVPLVLTLIYYQRPAVPLWVKMTVVIFYAAITLGTVLSWWVPYICGSSEKHKKMFGKFKNTHHFLPARGGNVIPNTLHVILHVQVWLCLAISIYFLVKTSFH